MFTPASPLSVTAVEEGRCSLVLGYRVSAVSWTARWATQSDVSVTICDCHGDRKRTAAP